MPTIISRFRYLSFVCVTVIIMKDMFYSRLNVLVNVVNDPQIVHIRENISENKFHRNLNL